MNMPRPIAELEPGKADADQVLVRRVQRGDKAAFDVLVRKYQHKIVKLVTRYVHDGAEALDVTHHGFRGDSAFYTWLYRIAINTAKNHLVAEGRRPLDHGMDLQDPEQYDVQSRLRDVDTPERLLLTDEIQRTVEAAIAALPEDLRTAIVLRELEGMSYEQIAETMGCPVGTVRSRIFRAREAIDEKLKPLLD